MVIIAGTTVFFGGSLTRGLLKRGITFYGVDIDTPELNEFRTNPNFIQIIADFTKYKEQAMQ